MNDETNLFRTLQTLRFYASPPHPCSYLENRQAVTVFVDPDAAMDMPTYLALSQAGFRRSGEFVYRPDCDHCRLCIPVRVPVRRFSPNRSQRRTWKKNRDLTLVRRQARYDESHFALYRRYMQARHPGGGMDNEDPDAYRRVMSADWSDTWLYEFRLENELLAVSVVDCGDDSLSAVYTFYSPDAPRRSLGAYAILRLIEEARSSGRDWLYLGYWNPDSPKMAYKNRYRPLEYFNGLTWRSTPPGF